ncbi:ferritin-like domain-containing protein [Candidatus Marinamargulisbacteria bacterium]|jgi:bacterioferritin|nr:ferritin-like domain-containing protein [Candidatus Marinamargulisbacteria bacterium]
MSNQELIDLLNQDLANEFAAIIQYTTYAAKVTGPFRPELSQFLLAEVADEQGHAKFLADKILVLGGEPTTQAASVAPANTNKAMLEAVLEAENRAIIGYTQRAEQAATLGHKALSLDLEDMIRDETRHSEEVSKILDGWNLYSSVQ